MTAYWKRLLISLGVVSASLLPAMIRDFQSAVVVGPWIAVLWNTDRFEAIRALPLAPPTGTVILPLLTLTVLALSSRWTVVAVLATLFFLVNALFLYLLMGADLGHAIQAPNLWSLGVARVPSN